MNPRSPSQICRILRVSSFSMRSKIIGRSFQGKSRSCRVETKDLTSALKPFLFMVHPDLFGNCPKKRDINENSLKKLNSFLQTHSLKGRQQNEKVSLKFYLRDPHLSDSDSITKISVNLEGASPRMVVQRILQSAGLPSLSYDHEKISEPRPRFLSRQQYSKKNVDYGDTFTGETLLTFLGKKSCLARSRLKQTCKLRKKTLAIIERTCEEFGFKSLSVESNWRILLLYGYLRNLYAFLDRHRNDVRNAAGWKVALSSWTGVDAQGIIRLNVEGEPLSWTKLLGSVNTFTTLLQETEILKSSISQMLGGLTIVSAEHGKNRQPLEAFLLLLRKLCLNLNASPSTHKVNVCLENYKGIVSGSESTACVLPNGVFLIPVSMNGSDIISFLTASKAEAKLAKEMHERQLNEEQQRTELCVKQLELRSLTRNTEVSHLEMIACCENLVSVDNVKVLMKGLKVKVGQLYHLSADGELTIPWNWKENG